MSLEVLVTALFGGAGATLLWELVLKPMRERRAVAEVLAAEVSLNLQLLAAAGSLANPRKIPPDFKLATRVFESIADKLGELPPQVVAEVVFLYHYFNELNEQPRAYVDCVKEIRGYELDSANYRATEREIFANVAVFNQYVQKATVRINLTQPLLLRAAFPWWSPRRWRRRQPELLKVEELQQRMAKSLREREALAAEVAERQAPGSR